MASSSLVLPGVLFVGASPSRDAREDDRARIVAHTGDAAGWFTPRGVMDWSHEVSVVVRSALTEDVRRNTKAVMPEEQIPPARLPLAHQAAQKSPLVAVASKLVPKLVESGIRVHTIGVDRITSSFYYIAEGGGEDPVRVEGDLVAAASAMLGDRADNAAIERVLDGLVDRLLRAVSRDRVSELSLELAVLLPRMAADGSGLADVDLESFEQELSRLIGESERFSSFAREIASKLTETNERRLEVPLYKEARKASQGPFDLSIGERTVSLPTYERWVMSGPFTEPTQKQEAKPEEKPVVVAEPAKAEPAKAAEPKPTTPKPAVAVAKAAPEPKPTSTPKPAVAKTSTPKPEPVLPKAPESKPDVKSEPKPTSTSTPKPAVAKAVSSGLTPKPSGAAVASPPRPVTGPTTPRSEGSATPEPVAAVAVVEAPKAAVEEAAPPAKVETPTVESPKAESPKVESPAKVEPAKVEEPKPAREEAKAPAAKAEPKVESKKDVAPEKAIAKTETKAVAKKDSTPPAPPVNKSSGSTLWIGLAAAAGIGWAVWHFFLSH